MNRLGEIALMMDKCYPSVDDHDKANGLNDSYISQYINTHCNTP